MLQDAHSRKISKPITAPIGDTVIVAGAADHWLYVHELIGDLADAGTLSVVGINPDASETILATFVLGAGQGITEQDEPGEDNRPRFEFKPSQNFVLRVTGAVFTGAAHYSIRY